MERFGFIFLVAGLGFFILAFAISAYLPILPVQDLRAASIQELSKDVPDSFVDLKNQYPQAFRKAFYAKTDEQALAELLAKAPQTFNSVFKKSPKDAINELRVLKPAVFKSVFGDVTAEQAVSLALDEFGGDEVKTRLKDADAEVYAAVFEKDRPITLQSALSALHADYPTTLLKIKIADPETYRQIFDERPDSEVLAEALLLGQSVYVGEACWHCHSQQVRPWGNDIARYGQPSYPEEYHNAMNYPPLWGTRRIGPDLIRRGGKLSNDWHVAHFYNPRDTSPVSVMPNYPWFYEADGRTPNKKGLAIIAYVQWLGSWQESRDETLSNVHDIDRHSSPK